MSPDEMKKYEELVAKDKQRYADEMKNYVPPDNDDDDDDDDGGKKKPAKKKKDPNAPKNPMSSYMLFSNHIRASVKEDNPGIKFGDIAKEVSKKYKKFTDQDRDKWGGKAEEDKKRYQHEMAAYKKKQVAEAADNLDDDDDDDDDDDE